MFPIVPVPGGTASLGDVITGMGREKGEAAQAQAQPALTQAQTQGQQLQNQEMQRQLKDDQIFRDAAANTNWDEPDPTKRMLEFQRRLIQGGISGRGYNTTMTNMAGLQQKYIQLPQDQLKLLTDEHQQAANAFEGYSNAKDPTQWPTTRAAMVKISPDLEAHLPAEAPDPSKQSEIQGFLGMSSHLADIAQKSAQTNQLRAAAAKDQAEAQKAQIESQRQQMVLDLIKSGQAAAQNGQHPIDAIFPASMDPQINASYKAAYDAAAKQPPDNEGRRPALDSIVSAAAQHASQIALANNPQKRAGEVATDLAKERAVAPVKIATSVATAKAEREGQNAALANVPPALATQAVTAAQKLDQEHNKARATADEMNAFIDAAEKGNKAAAANVPLAGVLQINTANGTKRVNRTEIDQYEGAGSLFDRIAGRLGKLTAGQPIPKDVLEDMRQLSDIVASKAYTEYTGGLDSLNQRTGSKFGPTQGPPKLHGQTGSLSVKAPNGKTYTFHSLQDADAFKQAAGIP